MIDRRLADRPAIDALRRGLARERILLEVRDGEGGPDWRTVSGDEPFDWSAPIPLAGPKRFFFPAKETLLRWHGDAVEQVEEPVEPVVLFGIRPCDLTAIAHQDRFFAADPRHRRRRAGALLVGLDCLRACAGGFCREVDAGPFARSGFDLNLTPLDDGSVALAVGSEAGREALARAGIAARPAAAAALQAHAVAEARARASFPERPFVAGAIARLEAGEIRDDEWQALGPSCLACTGCTSLCPTCSCFTVVDEASGDGGARTRVWDSCLLDGFQREASGQHPAPRPGDRVRRFWYHKLSRDFVPALGRIGCVGCGRCDVTCLGSIGALRVLERLGAS
jgi:formate hydrogenlyase subunit 6/NADH:ubiquinone oxidoreductase subunit I